MSAYGQKRRRTWKKPGKQCLNTLNHIEELILFLDDGRIPMDNNLAENAIRPFVVGRKNFFFSNTPEGAEVMARLYSLVETAKANKLNPTEYLTILFQQLLYAETEELLTCLLPQCLNTITPLPY